MTHRASRSGRQWRCSSETAGHGQGGCRCGHRRQTGFWALWTDFLRRVRRRQKKEGFSKDNRRLKKPSWRFRGKPGDGLICKRTDLSEQWPVSPGLSSGLSSYQIIHIFLGKKAFAVQKSQHRCSAPTTLALMCPLQILIIYISIQISLQGLKVAVNLFLNHNRLRYPPMYFVWI